MQYVSALRSRAGSEGEAVLTLNQSTPLDGGGRHLYWDSQCTDADDGALTIRPTGLAVGGWRTIVVAALLMLPWFEGKADCDGSTTGTDNSPAFIRADKAIKLNPQYHSVCLPYSLKPQIGTGYLFRGRIPVRNALNVIGGTAGMFGSRVNCYIVDTKGFQALSPAAPGGGCAGTFFQNIELVGNHDEVGQQYIEGQTGLYIENRSKLYNVGVSYFKGHGIHINANVQGIVGPEGDIYYGTNANSWRAELVDCNFNAGDGFRVEGGDTNAGLATMISCTKNGMYGIRDMSRLGCGFIVTQDADNAVYGGRKDNTRPVYVCKGGMVYLTDDTGNKHYFTCTQTHTNQKPIINQVTPYWNTQVVQSWNDKTEYHEDLVEYQGKYYTGHWHPNNPNIGKTPGTGLIIPGSNTPYWVEVVDVGKAPLLDYDPWDYSATYKALNFWAAIDDSLNDDPEINAYGKWNNMGTFNQWGLAFRWSPTLQCYGGGGHCSLSAASKSAWVYAYSENGEAHNNLQGGALSLGGQNEVSGTILGVANGRGLNIPGTTYFQSEVYQRGADGNGLYPTYRNIVAGQYGNMPAYNNQDEAMRYVFRAVAEIKQRLG